MMIECRRTGKEIWILAAVFILQLTVAVFFCMEKQGFHYDEYYSYYSSNATNGLGIEDRAWKTGEEIRKEFIVLPGEGFNYGMVKLMQSYDVHPPLYYFFLHTVSSFFPGIFSKWIGLSLNLLFFAIAYCLFARISFAVTKQNWKLTILACLLFGFQPGVLSGITFSRMYMLLLVWCMAVLCWHIPVWRTGLNITMARAWGLAALVTAGFLTHYYFVIFLFFLSAHTCLYQWWIEKHLKAGVIYAITVISGLAAAVVIYPSGLSHIFRGYRGIGAADAFLDLSNTAHRIQFFFTIVNESVFGNALWGMTLMMVVFLAAIAWRIKDGGKDISVQQRLRGAQGQLCILVVTSGYFVIIAKTALMVEEAYRYELPIYGLWILFILLGVYDCIRKFGNEAKIRDRLLIASVSVMLLCQIFALTQGKVQFLYPEDREAINWARGNKKATVIYLYNPVNQWMIWDESLELMQYEQIYFVSLADTAPITEEGLLEEERIYVYTSRMEEGEAMMDGLIENNPRMEKKEKIRELLYCDLYCLE